MTEGDDTNMSKEVQQLLRQWKVHRNVTIKLVKMLPEAMKDYKSWEGGMTTVAVIHHLAWTPLIFLSMITDYELEKPEVPDTIEEVLALLEANTVKHEKIISELTDEDLLKEGHIAPLNATETGEELLHFIIAHEAYHKGQLMTFARIHGIEPPFFVDFTVGKEQ